MIRLNTAVHELVHIVVNKIDKNSPKWLNEGVACYEAKDNNENWIQKTVEYGLVSNTIPIFKDLDTVEDFETFFKHNEYQYSNTIVESIIEKFGYDKLQNCQVCTKKMNEHANHLQKCRKRIDSSKPRSSR